VRLQDVAAEQDKGIAGPALGMSIGHADTSGLRQFIYTMQQFEYSWPFGKLVTANKQAGVFQNFSGELGQPERAGVPMRIVGSESRMPWKRKIGITTF